VIAQFAFDEGKIVFATFDTTVHRNPCADDDMIQSEYSLSLHAIMRSLIQESCCTQPMQHHKDTMIIANDIDVVVLAISFFSKIAAEKLWVTFGKGKKIRYLHSQYLQCLQKHMLFLIFMP